MKFTKTSANLCLLLISFLWGTGFIVTKIALDGGVTPGFINFSRGFLFVLLAYLCFHRRIHAMSRSDFKIGLIAGLINLGGYLTQTIGVQYTTPSNNAFICANYVIFVPFLAWLMYKKPLEGKSFVCIAGCIGGMAILSGVLETQFILNLGDVYSLVSALFYALSITYLCYGCKESDPTVVAFLLAAVQAVGGLLYFLLAESGSMQNVDWSAMILPLLYMGVLCSFLAQTFQVIVQRYTSATTAGLIMMLESVFGSIFSIVWGFEEFTPRLAIGGGVILLFLVISQVDLKTLLRPKAE